jgi:hypothetical protein
MLHVLDAVYKHYTEHSSCQPHELVEVAYESKSVNDMSASAFCSASERKNTVT